MNLDFKKRYLASDKSVRLCDEYSGRVLLIVNTASYCGYTRQFEGLEKLHEQYNADGGLTVGSHFEAELCRGEHSHNSRRRIAQMWAIIAALHANRSGTFACGQTGQTQRSSKTLLSHESACMQ